MKNGLTLVELLLVIALIGIIGTFAVSNVGGRLDSLAVNSAAADVTSAFAVARNAAIARATYTTVHVDSSRQAVTVSMNGDTLVTRLVGAVHGVAIRSNRDSLAYNPIGHGFGASNQTIVISRGNASDTVVVSRLGRVRHRP